MGNPGEPAPEVWVATPAEIGDEQFAAAWKVMLPAERADRFAFDRDAALFVTARGLIQEVLQGLLGESPAGAWRLEPGRSGRLFVSGRPDIDISISHTHGLVGVAAFQGGRCGVDVESLRSAVPDFGPSVLTPREAATLSGPDGAEGFVTYWTLKEAMSKAVGNGLGMDFDQVGFTDFRQGPCGLAEVLPEARLREFSRRPQDWRFHHDWVQGNEGDTGLAVAWTFRK